MSGMDALAQQILFFWILPIITAGTIYYVFVKYGSIIKDRFFVFFWSRAMVEYHQALKEMKRHHFSSMKYVESYDPDLKNRGLVRVLEIGAGSGANFEFFPPNCHLNVVEPNPYFEPLFYESQSKYPALKMEKFVLGTAEDMSRVPDNSVDIVVSTLVMCSVSSVEKTLQEIQRILAPGGKFYYWEHVHDTPGTWLHLVQDILSFKLWDLLFGCHLNRNLDHMIGSNKGFSQVDQKRFDIPFQKGVWKLVRVHVMGVATK